MNSQHSMNWRRIPRVYARTIGTPPTKGRPHRSMFMHWQRSPVLWTLFPPFIQAQQDRGAPKAPRTAHAAGLSSRDQHKHALYTYNNLRGSGADRVVARPFACAGRVGSQHRLYALELGSLQKQPHDAGPKRPTRVTRPGTTAVWRIFLDHNTLAISISASCSLSIHNAALGYASPHLLHRWHNASVGSFCVGGSHLPHTCRLISTPRKVPSRWSIMRTGCAYFPRDYA